MKLSEKKIEADRIEEDYKNLKPITEMVKFWRPEGGEYLGCPNCGHIIEGKDSIESSSIWAILTCGKCSAQWEVVGKIVGYRKYQRE